MIGFFGRVISAWQLVIRRSLAHGKLLSSVVLGVLLASAIMAGTVIYFDALRELALRKTFANISTTDLDVLVRAQRGPTTAFEFERVSTVINGQVDTHVAWLLTDRILAGKSPTFFLSTPGDEDVAGSDNARAYFAFMPRLLEHVTILPGGRAPRQQRVSGPGQPIVLEALVPQEAAELFGVGVGDRLVAVPPWEDVTPYITVVISGLFRRDDPGAEFWYLEKSVLQAATGASFRTVPFHVPQSVFLDELGPSLRKMDGIYAWLLTVDTGRLNARNTGVALARLEAMDRNLAAAMSSYRQTSLLNSALREYDRRIFFSKLPMFVVLILIGVVILYFVATLSSLIVEDRRAEVALMRSRGASSAQILAVFVLEGATIAGLAVVAGPPLAAATISVLGYTPAFSDLTDSGRLAVSVSGAAYMMSVLGGALSFTALIIPAVQASRIGVTRHRQEASRPVRQPALQRYYVDVLLLLISMFLFRQLTEQGSVVATSLFGEIVADQLLLALPGLILLASAMVLLRLFPLAMNLASRLLSSWLPVGLVMGVWQMARNPTHYARLSLLLILTAGLGVFASSFGATLERSFRERVLYATGSDVRLDGVQLQTRGERTSITDAYESVPGVKRASPVLKLTGYDLSRPLGQNYTILAVDGESFGEVAWFREDFASRPLEALLKSLKPDEPPRGIELGADARIIGLTVKPDRPHPSLEVTVRLEGSGDTYSTLTLGRLESNDWTKLEAALPGSDGPLKLASIMVHEVRGRSGLRRGSIVIDDVWVISEGGETRVIESFPSADGWTVLRSNGDSKSDVLRPSDVTFDGGSASVLFSWSGGSPLVGHGLFHGPERSPLPILASKSFVQASGRLEGDEFEISVSGLRVPVRLEGVVDLFPTMTLSDQEYMVADLTSLTGYANLGALHRELRANGVWISTEDADNLDRRELLSGLSQVSGFSVNSVNDRAERLANSKVDPLVSAGWRALLFIAFSAVLILSCLGFLVHAYVSFRNRELQFALLRTVGFSLRQLVTMVWLEQTLVIAIGMALGTWMGGRLGATIMPFLGHDDWGGRVVPPFVMDVNWAALVITYAAMFAVFAVISLGLIWLVQRLSLQRTLRLGEM